MAANITKNMTVNFDVLKISEPVVFLMRIQGTIIMLLNLIVVVTLVIKKSKFPAVYWLQILCLASNDILAGLANFVISFIDSRYIRDSLSNCCIAVIFLYSSQSASLYNIFGICIHRFVVLKRADLNSGTTWKHRHTILCTSIAWTLSIFLCSLPVIIYNKPDAYNKIKVCSLKPIFGKDIDKGMFIMSGSFIVPLIFTNILYITLFCMLKAVMKTVQPISTQTQSDSRSLYSGSAISSAKYSNRETLVTDISNKSFSSDRLEAQGPSVQTKRNSTRSNLFLKVPERNKTVELVTIEDISGPSASTSSDRVTSYPRSQLDRNSSVDGKNLPRTPQFTPPTFLRQRKAFTLLGIILLFLNIFSWPGVSALVLTSMVETISLDRNTLLPLFTTICFNSALNPILYTAAISEFRSALLDMFSSLYKLCKR